MDPSVIERMARLRGIGDAYHDYRGELRYFALQTKQALLRAMGCRVDDADAAARELSRLEVSRWRKFLPPLAATHGARIGVDINVTAREFGSALIWSVRFEDGSRRDGVTSTADCREIWRGEVEGSWITRRHLELPFDLPPGYHELEARIGAAAAERCALIVSPARCHAPVEILRGQRLWGIAVQLYTLRSRDNWGIGDFSDLRALIRWAASHGAGFIGLNPCMRSRPRTPRGPVLTAHRAGIFSMCCTSPFRRCPNSRNARRRRPAWPSLRSRTGWPGCVPASWWITAAWRT